MSESLENSRIADESLRREIKELQFDMESRMKDIQFLLKGIDRSLQINNSDLKREIEAVVSSKNLDTKMEVKESEIRLEKSISSLIGFMIGGFGLVSILMLMHMITSLFR